MGQGERDVWEEMAREREECGGCQRVGAAVLLAPLVVAVIVVLLWGGL